ncbi:uncharacterized protein LOC114363248 [Ostrinia furnacalis]|uniref:uncharacterized protein LOC114363248 n=1 Tax=Ostrinia furnacalis TaxID=93504 RepID=UPI00103C3382|nr:uncharacterized protein LOC114363248 [Ostrinia furnacalis]
MFGRPRCREWTPLATQQLRLRSLIQIVGYNIRPPEGSTVQCSFYLTLHHTTMSAPFYTSERISSPHPKWKEIDSELTHRMSSTNVVIRIWCHTMPPSDQTEPTQDTVIQTWGVYFTGLRYIGANLALNFTSDCFKSNTLVFQMHGGYFCSYKSLKLDIIPPENELEHGSLSSDSSGKTNLSRVTLEPKFIQNHKYLKESRSVSPSKFSKRYEKEYSKSNSPVERTFKQNFPAIRNSASMNIGSSQRVDRCRDGNEAKKVDPNYIYEHSPENLDVKEMTNGFSKNASAEELAGSNIDLSETAENYDLRNEMDGAPKYRYLALNFLKSEIRPSYNATKLQKLHLLQYSIKKRQEAVQEIKERIYQKSAVTNDSWSQPDESEIRLRYKSRSQKNLFSPDDEGLDKQKSSSQSDLTVKNGRIKEEKPPVSNGPRLALKLNDLLSFKSKPSPFQRSEHIRLTKQLEILRFKRIILSDERDSKLANIRRLKEIRAKLFEENQDIGSELMEDYHTLSRRTETVKDKKQSCAAVRELAARSHAALASLRCELLTQLHQIFYIEQVSVGGSCIPLFARGGDSTLFLYAMFLLNKCIAQLLWGRGMHVSDLRPTLANLQKLLTTPSNFADTSKLFGTYRWLADSQCPRTQSLRSLVATDRGKFRQFNRFKDAVDGQAPQVALKRHRHSRSVGSYHDDQESPNLDASTTSIMGSEPNIYNMKLTQANSADMPPSLLKTHNSDSEIPTHIEEKPSETSEEKVIFTLGEDTKLINLQSEKLVRISSNNGDEVCETCHDESVKRICSEIENFCSTSGIRDIHEGFDVAKHMETINDNMVKCVEGKSETETVACDTCENQDVCDVVCAKNVTDVIVIPSAEAILDTGQLTVEQDGDEK